MTDIKAKTGYRALLAAALLLGFLVVTLGAYVRLSDAGLGCPDWPGCYGRLMVPSAADSGAVNAAYPHRPLESGKAWREMLHRYAAGLLGVLIAALFVVAWRSRPRLSGDVAIAGSLVLVVVFQALLGMWTVTLLLKPLVVVAHLAGGFTVLALLWWLWMRSRGPLPADGARTASAGLRWLAFGGLVVLALQAALGGWTSSNYAAVACVGFPTCNGEWLPRMDFSEAFVLWRGLGIDYEGGVLDHPARVAIHFTHRMGALVAAGVLLVLGVALVRTTVVAWRNLGFVLIGVLGAQLLLGIGNVTLFLPLPVAVAHEGMAAVLLLVLVSINYRLGSPRSAVPP